MKRHLEKVTYGIGKAASIILFLLMAATLLTRVVSGFFVISKNSKTSICRDDSASLSRCFADLSSDTETRPPLSRKEMERRAVSLRLILDAPNASDALAPLKNDTLAEKAAGRPARRKKSDAKVPPKRRQAVAWQASYHTSLTTQDKIKAIARRTSDAQSILSFVTSSVPPEVCNAANLVCAMTLASKNLGDEAGDDNSTLQAEVTLISNILMHLLTERESYVFSTRQLSNIAWSLAKFKSGGIFIQDQLIDAIAVSLTTSLRGKAKAKAQELCMSCWAYGILRKRQRPTGWQESPTVKDDIFVTEELLGDGVEFQGFDESLRQEDQHEVGKQDEPTVSDILLDEIAVSLSDGICNLQWKELANVAWAYATLGRASSDASQPLLDQIAQEAKLRLTNETSHGIVHSRDISQLVWSLGVLQADNHRLAANFSTFVSAVSEQISQGLLIQRICRWSCADIVQTALSLAHARLDEQDLLIRLFQEAAIRLKSSSMANTSAMQLERKVFFDWELSILLWAQARLYLTEEINGVYKNFTQIAMETLGNSVEAGASLASLGIGPQERANIVWSLAVLEFWQSPSTQSVIKAVFVEASKDCEEQNSIQLDHAHQLWQAMSILEPLCPECFSSVPPWFRSYLDNEWKLEKARPKQSSARHRALSQTLELMGVDHMNEHDEDIDVAIVLKPKASWTHETVRGEMPEGVKVAVEFDGPAHFTRERPGKGPPRTLGHTVLKYRLLKHAGWNVVRVPYFVFDRIPFWASMERQRYVQRLLKTHGNLRFSDVDVSEYKAHIPNRQSRFD